jgi:phosphoribosylglycinamide formyltransferase 1
VRLAVLLSGSGTNLAALLDAVDADPGFGGEVVVVGDHPDRATWEDALADAVAAHEPDAVVLAGFMRIVSGRFLSRWPDRVLNTHPSLLPAFPGAHAVRDALSHGVKVTGSTVHLVDEQVDHGPIIAQQPVEVRPDDTEDTLHERIKAVEHTLFPDCIRALCQGRVHVDGRVVTVTPA